MTDLWPSDLQPSSYRSPASLVGEQNSYISSRTDGHVNLIVRDVSDKNGGLMALLSNEFRYKVDITAPQLNNYSFHLFSFSHPILLYPVTIEPSLPIRMELVTKEAIWAKDENDFMQFFAAVLRSEGVRSTIERIWGLSRNG